MSSCYLNMLMFMSVKHLVRGLVRRLLASMCTIFLCLLVWRLFMCFFVQPDNR